MAAPAGGGGATAATATWLARAGLKVVVFERERSPRFRIGESLPPLNLPMLRDLGLEDEMERRSMRNDAANFAERYYSRNTLGLKTAITSVPAANIFDTRHLWNLKLRRAGRSLVQHQQV